MANTVSRLTKSGSQYITGQFDEVTFNTSSGYKKNLIKYSNIQAAQFGGAYWASYCSGGDYSNFTPNTTDVLAPDNTYTAVKVVRNNVTVCGSNTGWGFLTTETNILKANTTYTASVWARVDANTNSTTFTLGLNDLNNNYQGFTANTTWQRFSITSTPSGVTNSLDRGIQFYTTNQNVTIYFWGPQLELGNTVTTYEQTDGNYLPVTNSKSKVDSTGNYYVAGQFDEVTFNPNSSYTINLLPYSQSWTNYIQTQANTTVTANSTTAPDGTLTGSTLTTTVAGIANDALIQKWNPTGISKSASPYCLSVYLKQGNCPTVAINLAMYNGTAYQDAILTLTWSNLSLAPSGTNTGAINYGVIPVGNGWYRLWCSITNNYSAAGVVGRVWVRSPGSGNLVGDYNYLWGMQIEPGSSPGIYQPTAAYTLLPVSSSSKIDSNGNYYLSGTYDEYTRGNNLVTNGLIYYMDPSKPDSWNGNTSLYDITRTQPAGSLVGTYGYSIDGGGSLAFNQNCYANTSITANVATFQPNSNFTMSIWCKFTSDPNYFDAGGAIGGLFDCAYFQGFGMEWTADANGKVIASSTGGVYGFVRTPTGEYIITGQLNIVKNKWYNFVWINNYSASTQYFYTDGAQVNTTGVSPDKYYNSNLPTSIMIGQGAAIEGGGSTFADRQNFPGLIGQALIYNRALSSSEVAQNFNDMRTQYGL
jgi:hypothetical protein